MNKIDWQKTAAVIFCISAAFVAGWLIFRYLLGIALPFIIAWTVAAIVSPAAGWLSEKSGISKKVCACVLLAIFLGIIILLLWWLCRRLVFESGRLLDWLRFGGGGRVISEVFDGASQFVSALSEKLPLLGDTFGFDEVEDYIDSLNSMFLKFISDILGKISSWLSVKVFGVFTGLPGFMVTMLVTAAASFYFCVDIEKINDSVKSILPSAAKGEIKRFRGRIYHAVGRWVRAYIILFFITALVLLLGFIVLGVEYPVLLALIGATIDILPVLGTGTMLIPWGLYTLVLHDFRLGFGLLILYAVVVVVKQIAEPKILGESLGLHPLLTLAALYAGYKLLGVAGALLLPPIITITLCALISKNKTKGE